MITSNKTTCTQHGGAPTRVLHVHMFTCFALKTDWVPWSNYSVACENRYYCDAALAGGAAPLFQPSPQSPLPFFLNLIPSLPACKYTALHWLYMCMHIYLFLTNQSSTYVCIYKYIYIHIISWLQFLFLHIVHI